MRSSSLMTGAALAVIGMAALMVRGPRRTRPRVAITEVGPLPLPDADDLWRWIQALNAFGPRMTASPAHAQAVDYLAAELESLGLQVHRLPHRIQRWTPQHCAVQLDDGTPIAVAAPYPYSGQTDAQGVHGRLVWLASARQMDAARDAIAVVQVDPVALSRAKAAMVFQRRAVLPDAGADFTRDEVMPILAPLVDPHLLVRARKAGVRAVICVFAGLSDALARDQVLPFTTPWMDCPALWVDQAAGNALRAAAQAGRSATLVLQAERTEAMTDSLHAVLPGQVRGESILVNTHTDGPNACEENGGAGLLALAAAFAKRPRRRDMVFVFASGHFQIPQFTDRGQATMAWLRAHPQWWDGKGRHARAVACLTLEHLGCMEWKDRPGRGAPQPTGRLEREIVYATNPVMEQVYRAAVAGRSKLRSVVVAPRFSALFLGEGASPYLCGIPGIGLVPGPDYLCQQLPDGGLERLDAGFAWQQVQSFARALAMLDAMAADTIGAATPALDRPLQRLRAVFPG